MKPVAFNIRMPWITSEVRGALSSNTWHWDYGGDTPSEANTAVLGAAMIAFYQDVLAPYLSSEFTGVATGSAYDLSLPKPRLPFSAGDFTFTPGSDSLPGEVAAKLGLKSARVVGVPSQRGRGTMQFGPLKQGAITGDGVLTTGMLDDLEAGLLALRTAANANGKTLITGSEAHGWVPVTQVILSNECGTVRRRQFPTTDHRVLTW